MSKTVLVVEDLADLRDTLMEILEDAGYAPAGAANGHVALEALRAGLVPRVILLDLQMPVMDGNEFLVAWRSDPKLSSIPVVVLSATVDMNDRLTDPSGAPLLRVRKPARIEELLRIIDCRLWLACFP